MKLDDYQQEAIKTDRTSDAKQALVPLTGLIGEIGSLISEFKKLIRDNPSSNLFTEQLVEELGDTIWYIATLAKRHDLNLSEIAHHALLLHSLNNASIPAANTLTFESFQMNAQNSQPQIIDINVNLFAALIQCANKASALTGEYIRAPDARSQQAIVKLGLAYILWELAIVSSIQKINLTTAAQNNLAKIRDMFGADQTPTTLFDIAFPGNEQFPREFEINFENIAQADGNDVSIMTRNGNQIGSQLTDNSYDETGYRFHDAIHYAFLAVLGWSPVMRALFKLKRKSNPRVDEVDDGARAAIIEEAIVAVTYDYARQNEMLNNRKSVSPSRVKLIQKLCHGFEVSQCRAWEWEKAILLGYEVFRKLRDNKGGTLVINLNKREITYKQKK